MNKEQRTKKKEQYHRTTFFSTPFFTPSSLLLHSLIITYFSPLLSVSGHSKATGWFCLFYVLHTSTDPTALPSTLSYQGWKETNVLTGTDALLNEKKHYDRTNLMRYYTHYTHYTHYQHYTIHTIHTIHTILYYTILHSTTLYTRTMVI